LGKYDECQQDFEVLQNMTLVCKKNAFVSKDITNKAQM